LAERYPDDLREIGILEEAADVLPALSQDEELADKGAGTQKKAKDNGIASSSEKPPRSLLEVHDSTEKISDEYRDSNTGEPYGPLIGNKTELGYAIHPNAETTSESQLRRYLSNASGK
jgi:hypothetical protein